MESVVADAKQIVSNLLPEKSKDKYLQVYNNFMKWKQEKNLDNNSFSEEIVLVYFDFLQKKYKSSSFWSFYSMLRTTIERNHNVDINYPKLHSLLKKYSIGFQSKKSNVFEASDVGKFLDAAPDDEFLDTKVIMIFGVYGATRADELTKVTIADVVERVNVFIITIPHTKNNVVRTFTVEHEHADFIRKYRDLRPSKLLSTRFFINFKKGKCFNQPIGRNKFLNAPKVVATYLQLKEPELYTGHSFRRTSATVLADAGVEITYSARGKTRMHTQLISVAKGAAIGRGDSELWSGKVLQIPPVPPSKLGNCGIINVQYHLMMEMDLSGPSINVKGSVPIIIGTIPLRNTFEELEFHQNEINFPETHWDSPGPSHGLPPPYTNISVPPSRSPVPSAPAFEAYPDLPPPTYADAVAFEKFVPPPEENLGEDNGGFGADNPPAPINDYSDYVPTYITYGWMSASGPERQPNENMPTKR